MKEHITKRIGVIGMIDTAERKDLLKKYKLR